MKFTFILLSVIILAGCSFKPKEKITVPVYTTIQYPVELLIPCQNLNTLIGVNGKSFLHWSYNTVEKYRECQLKHNTLIDMIKENK